MNLFKCLTIADFCPICVAYFLLVKFSFVLLLTALPM
jgi:hypothetical protein